MHDSPTRSDVMGDTRSLVQSTVNSGVLPAQKRETREDGEEPSKRSLGDSASRNNDSDNRLADLIALGEAPFPLDLTSRACLALAEAVRTRRRTYLLAFLARQIAAAIVAATDEFKSE
jgi:hypothetical protein